MLLPVDADSPSSDDGNGQAGTTPPNAAGVRRHGKMLRRLGMAATLLGGAVYALTAALSPGDLQTTVALRRPRRLDYNGALGATPFGGAQASESLYYKGNEAAFQDVLRECVKEAECRIFLNHIHKTGGTSIEKVMFATFPPKAWTVRDTCCGARLAKRVASNLDSFCMPKFSSYQLDGPQFEEVLRSCVALYAGTKALGKPARVVVITSIREPIQRALSQIHQICNKNSKWREEETRKACKRCSYEQDADFWDGFAKDYLNEALRTAKHVTDLRMQDVRHLVIDMLDLRSFFLGLRESMAGLGVHVPDPAHKNGEQTQVCDFSMSSAMMKALKPSVGIYRNLTAGL